MQLQQNDDFIGIYENVLPEGLCEKFIRHWQELEKNGLIFNRQTHQNVPQHVIDDNAYALVGSSWFDETNISYLCQDFTQAFWPNCYKEYCKKYSIINAFAAHQIYEVKIQKTIPGQGYHTWHCESTNRHNSNRLLAFILYLNDVEEGGETEFLYLSKRITPKKNRLVLWPSGFTHTHRGNQPLSGEKYILTGWVEF